MSRTPILQVQELYLFRGGKRLLGPLNLQLLPGERGLLCGGNGSGKTTLVETLCGCLPQQQGCVKHLGRLGYAPQEPRFPNHLRCEDYLAQLFGLMGNPKSQCKAAIHEALELFQLLRFRRHTVGSLSRGWRQRMNLARAWLGTPELLLLDEPQTALDPEGMEHLVAALRKASSSAVLVVAPVGVGCESLAPQIGTLQTTEGLCSA